MTVISCVGCRAKNAMDVLFSRSHSSTEPWLVHAELQLDGQLSERRLVHALEQVDLRHPMLRVGPCPTHPRHWQHHDAPRSKVVVERVADDRVDARRNEILSTPVDVTEQVFRLHVLQSRAGDRVVGVGHHSAVDGAGLHRALVDLGLAYAGVPLVPETSWEAARDLRVGDLAPDIAATVATSLRDRTRRTPVRIAHGASSEAVGVGALLAPLPDHAWSVDVLVAALARTVERWNRERDRPVVPLVIGVALNLRALDRWSEGLGNASIVWPVVVDPTQSDDDLLRSVRSQLKDVRLGRRSRAVRGFLSALPEGGTLPLWASRVMACTTAISAVKGLDADADFGEGAPRVLSGWGTPPVSAFTGAAFGARLDEGASWISVRYLRSWFSADSIRDLLGRLPATYRLLSGTADREAPGVIGSNS